MQRHNNDETDAGATETKAMVGKTRRPLVVKIGFSVVIFLAAATTLFVNLERIAGWFGGEAQDVVDGRDNPTQSGSVAQDLGEDTDGVAGPDRSVTGDSPGCGPQLSSLETVGTTPQALVQAAPIPADDVVLVGYSRDSMRARNGVRRMLPLEERQDLSRLTQVYGFANHQFMQVMVDRRNRGDSWPDALDFPSVRLSGEQSRAYGVELHALAQGQVVVLVCVSQGDATRLSDPKGGAREVFVFYLDGEETPPVLVGIPLSRIRSWDARTRDFGVIDVD